MSTLNVGTRNVMMIARHQTGSTVTPKSVPSVMPLSRRMVAVTTWCVVPARLGSVGSAKDLGSLMDQAGMTNFQSACVYHYPHYTQVQM